MSPIIHVSCLALEIPARHKSFANRRLAEDFEILLMMPDFEMLHVMPGLEITRLMKHFKTRPQTYFKIMQQTLFSVTMWLMRSIMLAMHVSHSQSQAYKTGSQLTLYI